MKVLLHISGHDFELQQRFGACTRPPAEGPGMGDRKFRGLLLADLAPVGAAMQSCKMLSDSRCWDAMPSLSKHGEFRLEVFQTVTTYYCLLGELREEFESYTFKLFKLLRQPGLVAAIMEERCLWDTWATGFITVWSERGGITCEGALFDLRVVVGLGSWDTAGVDVSHSRVRRSLEGGSTQTHLTSLEDASALEVLRWSRSRRPREAHDSSLATCSRLCHSRPAQNLEEEAPGSSEKRRRVGGGGPYRAFMSEDVRKGARIGDADLSAKYRTAMEDPALRERCRLLGQLATQQNREGCNNPFGPTNRDVLRASSKVARAELAKGAAQVSGQLLDLQDSSSLAVHGSAAQPVLGEGFDWKHVLQAKADALAEATLGRELRRMQEEALHTFQDDPKGGRLALAVLE